MKKWLMVCLAILVISLLSLAGCGTTDATQENVIVEEQEAAPIEIENEESPALQLYTTIFALEDFITKIGGEHVAVTNMVPVGVDAHTYEPTVREMIAVAESDGFFYSGGGMEGFIDSIKQSLRDENVPMIEASEGIPFIQGTSYSHSHSHGDEDDDHHHHHHGDQDPHVWIDPIRAVSLAENVRDGLIDLRPEAEEEFRLNTEVLVEQLHELHLLFEEQVADASRKTILVAHAGYTYWEERYGIEQIAITGFSPTNEPSLRQLQEIIDFANDHGLRYVAFESNYRIPVAESMMEEIGGDILYLYNLENVSADDRENGYDYFDLMKENIETVNILLNHIK